MKNIFSQTAECCITNPLNSTDLQALPEIIRNHTEWNYSCKQTNTGYFLEPTFRNMPYRNSFVPEIDVAVSCDNGQTVLHMRGQPVPLIRAFNIVYFCFLGLVEILTIIFAFFSVLDSLLLFLLVPIGMCLFGYLLCKIATKRTFMSIVKAIQKGFS